MKRAIVLGLGVSGQGAKAWLESQGYTVIGLDRKGQEKVDDWSCVELFVLSPGIAPDHFLVTEAKKRGVPVVGEAELAISHLSKPMVACTGTNGKTSVVLLTEHVLNTCGIKAKALGNVGSSLCQYLLDGGDEEVLIVELSSYQLETMHTRKFLQVVILNITPDHLERYASIYDYAKTKARLQDLVVEGGECFVHEMAACNYPDLFEGKPTFRTLDCGLGLHAHDAENAMAAYLLCKPFNVSVEQFVEAMRSFKKPAHRLEWVEDIKDVSYYDDSKSTNVDSTLRAVEAMQKRVVLIAGGVDKGFSYKAWKEAFADRVKVVVALGEAADKIATELEGVVEIKRASSMQEAVQKASKLAECGECVLLSPGCASFDQFRDYIHRGEVFKKSVRDLKESQE